MIEPVTPAVEMVKRIIVALAIQEEAPATEAEAVHWLAVAFLEEHCEAHALWGDKHGAGALVEELRTAVHPYQSP